MFRRIGQKLQYDPELHVTSTVGRIHLIKGFRIQCAGITHSQQSCLSHVTHSLLNLNAVPINALACQVQVVQMSYSIVLGTNVKSATGET